MNETPSPWLLRVEGVNLYRFVFDTRDLSTIRGGGLLMLEAGRRLRNRLTKTFPGTTFEDVSSGASSCILAFNADRRTACSIRTHSMDFFRGHADDAVRSATFVVDVISTEPDRFAQDLRCLQAANRWRQMRQSSVAIPARNTSRDTRICEIDGVRPVAHTIERRKENHIVQTPASMATHGRHKEGRNAKQDFYAQYANLPEGSMRYDFAHHFEDIAQSTGHGGLNDKMAVFYADGNKFGTLVRTNTRTKPDLSRIDRFIRDRQQQFLAEVLRDELLVRPEWLNPKCPKNPDSDLEEPRYRFETLLWGGDEFMFVMPAWLGWRFARIFFEKTSDWNLRDAGLRNEAGDIVEAPLTHTAALVFCHHHSPIHRIKDLAKRQMTEFAKDLVRNRSQRNQLVYQVLESFDHLGTAYQSALERRFGGWFPITQLVLHDDEPTREKPKSLAEKMRIIADGISRLRADDSEFPRGQLRDLVARLVRQPQAVEPEKPAVFEAQLQRFAGPEGHAVQETLKGLRECVESNAALWFHLEESWDYARP